MYLAITASCRNCSQRLKHPGKLRALSLPVPRGCGQLLGVLLSSTLSVHLVWAPQGGGDRQMPHFLLPGRVDAAWAGLHGPGLRRGAWPGMCWGKATCLWPWRCGGSPSSAAALQKHSSEAQIIGLAKMLSVTPATAPVPLDSTPPLGSPKAARGQTAMSTGKSEGWQSSWGQ